MKDTRILGNCCLRFTMKVNAVLILAAGKGTRMGEIGKSIPKVLWPVYEKSLLELQVHYAKRLAPTAKIYINYYNYKNEMEHFKRLNEDSFVDVEFIEEHEVLDIGGAIHNLCHELDYDGNLLILNSDQFVYCQKEIIDTGLERLKENKVLLFTYEVNSSESYNALSIQNGKLLKIIKNAELPRNQNIQTYTGMSLVAMNKLEPISGESSFFESVALFDNKTITTELKKFEYWDFGTSRRYYESMFKILKHIDSDSEFISFLKSVKSIDTKKVKIKGYNSTEGINLSTHSKHTIGNKDIFLAGTYCDERKGDARIIWNGVVNLV